MYQRATIQPSNNVRGTAYRGGFFFYSGSGGGGDPISSVERLEAPAWLGWSVPPLIAEPMLQWHRFQLRQES
jgi:hypothetical protein